VTLAGFQLRSPQVTSISVAMMIPQNQAIIDVARAELLYGHNDELRRLAETIVAQQQQHISVMNGAVGNAAVDADGGSAAGFRTHSKLIR
jgi:uncharacterized protein (DUF305 family)